MTHSLRVQLRSGSGFGSRARLLPVAIAVLSTCATLSCLGPMPEVRSPTLSELRRDAPGGADAELSGEWLFAELVSPGGDAGRARKARQRLDELGGGGMVAALARGLDDALHGRIEASTEHYLRAVKAARDTADERSPLVAWFAASRALDQSRAHPGLWPRWERFVAAAIRDPRAMGWRARGELVEWSIDAKWMAGENTDALAVKEYGCVTRARLAGPFGKGKVVDAVTAFAAEKPGAWPGRWEPEPGRTRGPRVLPTKSHSCALRTDERPGDGIYYVETFLDVAERREVLLAVQGALAVLVDDRLVLDRDVRRWGVWPKFGVALELGPGRHRIVARIGEPITSIRVMNLDGTPAGIHGTDEPGGLYGVTAPRLLTDPNVLSRFVHDERVEEPKDDLSRFLGAFLLHVESSDDVGAVLASPLYSKVETATGPSLALAALLAEGDPIYPASDARDLVRDLHGRAARKDPSLWASRLALALGLAERKGAEEAVPELQRLRKDFPDVADVGLALARVYGELGWAPQHEGTLRDLLSRFPDDLSVLHAGIDVLEARGETKAVDAILEKIRRRDRDDELGLTRALAREDYARAVRELERLLALHPERLELAERLHDARVRAGETGEIQRKLEAAVAAAPGNPRPHLDLADARFAEGDRGALHGALADAVQAGASPLLLANAIDLVDGVTELEPYRLDAHAIIRAYEKGERHMEGTAARILDYAAVWVRADGSSRMLEHQVVRLQSAEGIAAFAEHRMLEGLVLHMRVIKKDGTTLEPEIVAGKPTVTFPHLEIGDYIETEQVVFFPGDGSGAEYAGPRWFFREENVAYARSEFVVITPEGRDLIVEATGNAPAPTVTVSGGLVTRRFRADYSTAAPSEPGSVPVSEFLPSVRIGWGLSLERRLSALGDALAPMTPVDPRIRSVAVNLTRGIPKADVVGRARKLYRWLSDNVEPGEESDGRRIVIGKSGNLWHGFRLLCRAVDIPVRYAVAQSRLAPPPTGPLSRASLFTHPVALIEAGGKATWLTLGNKYAPFGWVPAEVRGMPVRFLDGDRAEKATVPVEGSPDSIAYSGRGKLDATGALSLELVQEFSGKLAMALRQGLAQVPEDRLPGVLQSNLLAQSIRGGELVRHVIERRDDFDAPLSIRMTVKVPRFAQINAGELVIAPPFGPSLGRLAILEARSTPLLLGDALHRKVSLEIELPKGASVSVPEVAPVAQGDRAVTVRDSAKGSTLRLERTVSIPAGRVQPAEYPAFVRFARSADDALSRGIRIRLP